MLTSLKDNVMNILNNIQSKFLEDLDQITLDKLSPIDNLEEEELLEILDSIIAKLNQTDLDFKFHTDIYTVEYALDIIYKLLYDRYGSIMLSLVYNEENSASYVFTDKLISDYESSYNGYKNLENIDSIYGIMVGKFANVKNILNSIIQTGEFSMDEIFKQGFFSTISEIIEIRKKLEASKECYREYNKKKEEYDDYFNFNYKLTCKIKKIIGSIIYRNLFGNEQEKILNELEDFLECINLLNKGGKIEGIGDIKGILAIRDNYTYIAKEYDAKKPKMDEILYESDYIEKSNEIYLAETKNQLSDYSFDQLLSIINEYICDIKEKPFYLLFDEKHQKSICLRAVDNFYKNEISKYAQETDIQIENLKKIFEILDSGFEKMQDSLILLKKMYQDYLNGYENNSKNIEWEKRTDLRNCRISNLLKEFTEYLNLYSFITGKSYEQTKNVFLEKSPFFQQFTDALNVREIYDGNNWEQHIYGMGGPVEFHRDILTLNDIVTAPVIPSDHYVIKNDFYDIDAIYAAKMIAQVIDDIYVPNFQKCILVDLSLANEKKEDIMNFKDLLDNVKEIVTKLKLIFGSLNYYYLASNDLINSIDINCTLRSKLIVINKVLLELKNKVDSVIEYSNNKYNDFENALESVKEVEALEQKVNEIDRSRGRLDYSRCHLR